MLQNGASLTNPNTPLGQSALTFYTNFFKVDHVWDDTLPSSTTYFANGKLAVYFGKYHDANIISTQNPSLHFAVVPLPQLPKTDPTQANVSYASYWVNGVSKASATPSVAWDFLNFMTTQQSLRELYTNEKKVRGYGNLYPRPDMQKELLSEIVAGPFIYEAPFAKSWYLDANTFDGLTGINTQVAKPFSDAISGTNGNSTADQALQNAMAPLTSVLASYGLVAAPLATP